MTKISCRSLIKIFGQHVPALSFPLNSMSLIAWWYRTEDDFCSLTPYFCYTIWRKLVSFTCKLFNGLELLNSSHLAVVD